MTTEQNQNKATSRPEVAWSDECGCALERKVRLELIPTTLAEANDFVAQYHRHNGRTARNGGKWAVACGTEAIGLVGVAIVGNPLSATFMNGFTAEITRLCTRPDAPRNACSMLYAACWRAWRAMGGRKLITYTLQSESGESLRGAGFRVVAECKGGGWNRPNIGRLREWQPIYGQQKLRWEVEA